MMGSHVSCYVVGLCMNGTGGEIRMNPNYQGWAVTGLDLPMARETKRQRISRRRRTRKARKANRLHTT